MGTHDPASEDALLVKGGRKEDAMSAVHPVAWSALSECGVWADSALRLMKWYQVSK
jgi:hypothetical protein